MLKQLNRTYVHYSYSKLTGEQKPSLCRIKCESVDGNFDNRHIKVRSNKCGRIPSFVSTYFYSVSGFLDPQSSCANLNNLYYPTDLRAHLHGYLHGALWFTQDTKCHHRHRQCTIFARPIPLTLSLSEEQYFNALSAPSNFIAVY